MADKPMKFYSVQKLGDKRRVSPEGYLIVEDVPLARTGTQLYTAGEVPVPPGLDGVVRIEREEDQVFRAETMASANGKDIVDEHPMQSEPGEEGWDVNPHNYGQVTKGVIINPRRGTGADSDLLIGDVMIKDAGAIRAVLDGKVELSCGYNADYETIEPGRGRQHNIVINHVALVDSGRCGPRCAIGDEDTMTARTRDKKKPSTLDKAFAALDKIKRGWGARDEKLIEEGMTEVRDEMSGMTPESPDPTGGVGGGEPGAGDSHVHIHLNGAAGNGAASGPGTVGEADDAEMGEAKTPEQRIDALEAGMAKIIQILQGQGGEGEGEAVEEEEEEGDDVVTGDEALPRLGIEDPVPEATGDDATKLMTDPVPAATGDGATVLGRAVEDKDGKIYLQRKTDDKRTVVGLVVKTKDGKTVFRKTVKVRDSAHLADNFTDVLARGEILVPGMKLPTYDAKMSATHTVKTMCDFRRQTLQRALATDASAHVVAIGGASTADSLPRMPCDAVKILFNGASELVRAANNRGEGARTGDRRTKDDDTKVIRTLGDVNAANRKLHGQPAR